MIDDEVIGGKCGELDFNNFPDAKFCVPGPAVCG